MAKGSRYVAPDPAEVRRVFEAAGFKEMTRNNTEREIAFCRVLPTADLLIVVYTTIDGEGQGESGRAWGADAGRVVVMWSKTNRPVWSATKVLRTKSFVPNLLERAREAWRAASNMRRCPDCGAPMVERKSRVGSKFWGCAAYPNCRKTFPKEEA